MTTPDPDEHALTALAVVRSIINRDSLALAALWGDTTREDLMAVAVRLAGYLASCVTEKAEDFEMTPDELLDRMVRSRLAGDTR